MLSAIGTKLKEAVLSVAPIALIVLALAFTITVVHSGKGWFRAKTVYVKGEPFKLLQWNSVAVFPLCRTRDLFSCILPSFDAAVCSRCISVFYIITGGNVCTMGEKKGR